MKIHRTAFCLSILLLSLIFLNLIIIAQQPTQEWVARWPTPESPNSSIGRSIKEDANGFIYVLADTGLGFGFLKYDQSGNLLLSVHHTPSGNWTSGGASHFDVSPSGEVYVTGPVYIEIYNWIYTVKFSQSGVFQWGKIYNPDVINTPGDIRIDNNNNIIVAGSANTGSESHALLIKYNPSGDTSWVRYFNIGNRGRIDKIVIDDSNNIYTTGIGAQLPGKCMILKYNSLGVQMWNQVFTLDVQRANVGWGIELDINGKIYVIGTQFKPQSQIDTYLLNLNNSGDTIWSRTFPGFGPGNFSLWGPIISSDANFIYYTGSYYGVGNDYDIVTLKYDSFGNSIWSKTFTGDTLGQDLPAGIEFDMNENVYVYGSAVFQSTRGDCIVIKYLPTGTLHWVTRYTGLLSNGSDGASDIVLNSNNLFVAGRSRKTLGFNYDAITIKYDNIIGLFTGSSELPLNYMLYQNYPNPFNSTTIISYSIPIESYVKLQLYNSLGQHVKDLVNTVQEASNYSIAVNMEGFSSGVYFCKFIAEEKYSKTIKILYVK